MFTQTYKNLKGIPLKLAYRIELDESIALAHRAKYRMNPNYATTIKQDRNKLLATRLYSLQKKPHVVIINKGSTQEK